mgnify:CR=1 FL=1
MKDRLNITIEKELIHSAKQYAVANKISLSKLVAQYFEMLNRTIQDNNIIDMVEQLPKPKIDLKADLKRDYYEAHK